MNIFVRTLKIRPEITSVPDRAVLQAAATRGEDEAAGEGRGAPHAVPRPYGDRRRGATNTTLRIFTQDQWTESYQIKSAK